MELDNQYKQDSIFVATPSMRSAERVASLLGIGAKTIHKRVSERGPASVQVTARHLPSSSGMVQDGNRQPSHFQGPRIGNGTPAILGKRNPIRGQWCNE
jgi:hypothetical protein